MRCLVLVLFMLGGVLGAGNPTPSPTQSLTPRAGHKFDGCVFLKFRYTNSAVWTAVRRSNAALELRASGMDAYVAMGSVAAEDFLKMRDVDQVDLTEWSSVGGSK